MSLRALVVLIAKSLSHHPGAKTDEAVHPPGRRERVAQRVRRQRRPPRRLLPRERAVRHARAKGGRVALARPVEDLALQVQRGRSVPGNGESWMRE